MISRVDIEGLFEYDFFLFAVVDERLQKAPYNLKTSEVDRHNSPYQRGGKYHYTVGDAMVIPRR